MSNGAEDLCLEIYPSNRNPAEVLFRCALPAHPDNPNAHFFVFPDDPRVSGDRRG